MANTTKVNSERNILKETVDNIITKLNNYLMVADLKQRYVLTWEKGTGQIANENSQIPITHYYSLALKIVEEDGLEIPIYGGHYPIKNGTSQIWINEAETKAYKDLLTHSIGTLISVQHGMFLSLRRAEEQEMSFTDANANAKPYEVEPPKED